MPHNARARELAFRSKRIRSSLNNFLSGHIDLANQVRFSLPRRINAGVISRDMQDLSNNLRQGQALNSDDKTPQYIPEVDFGLVFRFGFAFFFFFLLLFFFVGLA
tara:strand:- start:1768 stop:2082 length:315 start_codon:yes stop_codon:yes gene_type:complete